MGSATRREARERGDAKWYRAARAAGHIVRETPSGQYWVEPQRGVLMDWSTATMTAVARHQVGMLALQYGLTPAQIAELTRDFVVRTTKTGWGAGEARRRMIADAKHWTAHQKAAAKHTQARLPSISAGAYGSRPGTQAAAYKTAIMRAPKLSDEALHKAVGVALGGAKKAGPLSYVGWYRNWLTKRGYLK